jgi:TetR/AcrR family transcriptional repressor of nem operon
MRVSREQATENRERVIDVASRLFREFGFDGIGIAELMKNAGLTQGGFYKQFKSKEDLVAQATERAARHAAERWEKAASTRPDHPLEAILDLYISTGHRDERAEGCPLTALGSDAARQGGEVKAAFEHGIRAYLQTLEKLLPGTSEGQRAAIMSMMVGAVTLSRTVNDPALSRAVLEGTKAQIRALAAG